MTRNTIFFTITFVGLFALPLNAAENKQLSVTTPDSSGQIDPVLDDDIAPAGALKEQTSEPSPEQSSKPVPQGDNLRVRNIGDAFKNFQPSEEISADKPVILPVDI